MLVCSLSGSAVFVNVSNGMSPLLVKSSTSPLLMAGVPVDVKDCSVVRSVSATPLAVVLTYSGACVDWPIGVDSSIETSPLPSQMLVVAFSMLPAVVMFSGEGVLFSGLEVDSSIAIFPLP